jgi:anti-sigma regulatory factor (Ser/Thr protein kinase)
MPQTRWTSPAVSASASAAAHMRRLAVISAPAQERHVSTVRHNAAACLNAWRLSTDDQHWGLLIVGELAGNAAVHGRGDMTLGLTLTDMTLSIHVTDYGDAPRADGRTSRRDKDEGGRGLGIVRRLAQSVDFTTTVNATHVRAVYRIEPPRAT